MAIWEDKLNQVIGYGGWNQVICFSKSTASSVAIETYLNMKKNLLLFLCASILTFLIDITFAIQIGQLTWIVCIVVGFFSCLLVYRFQIKKWIEFLLIFLPLFSLSIFIWFVNTDLFLFAIPIIYLGLLIGIGTAIGFIKLKQQQHKFSLWLGLLFLSFCGYRYFIPSYYMYVNSFYPKVNTYSWSTGIVDLQGKSFDIKNYQGKVLVMAISSTHCAPCRRQDIALERIARLHQDTSTLIVIHVFTSIKDPNELITFLKKHPNIQDVYIANAILLQQLKFDGTPNTIVFNKSGEISWVHRGFPAPNNQYLYEQELVAEIQKNMKGAME
jgi:hypothetical protein